MFEEFEEFEMFKSVGNFETLKPCPSAALRVL